MAVMLIVAGKLFHDFVFYGIWRNNAGLFLLLSVYVEEFFTVEFGH